jgi:hypothetical protein
MAYIFLDESGDLGFDFSKKKTSQYFVVTFLFVHKKRPVEKVIKNIFAEFSKREIKKHGGVLHAHKEKQKTRVIVLSELAQKDISILSICLNKKKVYTKLHDEKHVLYNYVANILIDRIRTKGLIPLDEPIKLIASRRETNRFLNDNFRSYIEDQAETTHKLNMSIEIKTPHQEQCLQAVDFACWAIFRKQEHGDRSYYDLIWPRIVEENPLFP